MITPTPPINGEPAEGATTANADPVNLPVDKDKLTRTQRCMRQL